MKKSHDKDLKVIDIAEYKFWRKFKTHVELLVCGPIMNLL